jgi:hypothetical protein
MISVPMNDQPAPSHGERSRLADPQEQVPVPDTVLLALYSENGQIARTMVEWRHKLILLFVVTVGGLATSSIWLREHHMRVTLRWELVVGSLVMCLFVLMEQRTTLILHDCYRIGSALEESLAKTTGPAIYSALHATQSNLITYSNLLRLSYLFTAVALAISALCLPS